MTMSLAQVQFAALRAKIARRPGGIPLDHYELEPADISRPNFPPAFSARPVSRAKIARRFDGFARPWVKVAEVVQLTERVEYVVPVFVRRRRSF
jgi:hypothetical protein